jgi:hypothetical protein
MSQFENFSSLSPEEERTFIPYEERQQRALKSGATKGIIAGLALGLFLVVVSIAGTGKEPPKLHEEAPEAATPAAAPAEQPAQE